ncbi:hypothetical protein [uncultured Muribaculum sp.]|uniref:hypothetical protein n=1 Tax=uncultured Muribaculum sp. TaxID=1918613 RepID=UPI00266F14C5|nr:hypothetical protein [uncultured Muribaculum sp.]
MNASKLSKIFLTIIIGITTLNAMADVREEINAIKLDEKYLFAEATDAEPNKAFESALYELTLIINDVRSSKGKNTIEPRDIMGMAEQKSYPRGNKTLSFVYLPTEKALNVKPRANKDIAIAQTHKPDSATNTAVVGMPDSVVPETVQQVAPHTFATTHSNNGAASVSARICEYEMATEANMALKKYKNEGSISQFARAHSIDEIPKDAHLLLFDRNRVIQAVLGPDNGSGRTNLRTKQPDNLNNYHQVAIIWYK